LGTRLVADVRLSAADLVLPVFVKEGIADPAPLSSMPGVVQHTRDSLRKAAVEAVEAGVGGLILFGIPEVKDARGHSFLFFRLAAASRCCFILAF
jgi:porphobilinogen synthase